MVASKPVAVGFNNPIAFALLLEIRKNELRAELSVSKTTAPLRSFVRRSMEDALTKLLVTEASLAVV